MEGIVVTITMWQWCFEFFGGLVFLIFTALAYGESRTQDHFAAITNIILNHICIPFFYFLADSSFRNALSQEGLICATWKALKQKYD